MNTRSSILTAALLCLAALTSAPMASAQFPVDCVDVGGELPEPNPDCLPISPGPVPNGPHTIRIPGGDLTGGSDGCGLDDGEPTPVADPVSVPTPELGGPCLEDFASVTITGEGAGTVVHIHFFQPPALPDDAFNDGDRAIEDLYLSGEADFDGDGLSAQMEFNCSGGRSNPFNPASTCQDTDGDGLHYYTATMTATECSGVGGTYAGGECQVDEETECPGHDLGEACDPRLWDTDGDDTNDKDDDFPTDPTNGDPDGDGLLAADETACGTDPTKKDTDSDGRHDGIECGPQAQDTDPLDADTDDDGYSDGAEFDAGTDPTNASSFPVQGPDGCLDSDACLVGPLLYEDQPECDPTDTQYDPTAAPDCIPVGTDPCEDVGNIPVVCGDVPSTEPCDYEPPMVCGGGDPAPGSPADQFDPWDTNGNGKTLEPNGQVDVVEQLVFYYDFDEAASSARELNKDLEGSGGVTLVVWAPTPAGTPKEAYRLHIGDAGPSGGGRPSELLVLEEGPRGSPTSVTCLYTDGGQPHVAFRNGAQFDGSQPDEPCGAPVDAIGELNAIGAILGNVVVATLPAGTEPRPLFEVTDGNGDGVPEFVTLNLPDPESCEPAAQACTDYADPLVLPPEGVDPNELCGAAEGGFPGCLVEDCVDPTDCAPEPPCDPGPDCVPTPDDPTGDAIPPCSEVDTTQPAYVCFTNDEDGGAVTSNLEMNKLKVVLPGRPPLYL